MLVTRVSRLVERTSTRLDDVVLATIRRYWLWGAFFLALAAAARAAPVEVDLRQVGSRLFLSAFLVVLVLASARFVEGWLGVRSPGGGSRPSLLQTSVRVAVLVSGFLLVLANLGVEVTPLLTALGVGSLAIGLALQPTLSNFFAGMHLSMSKPIRVGDFVELEDGSQGEVVDIGWRATRLRQLANNLLVVPNSRLAEMRLLNYSLPDLPQAVLVSVGVAYGSDLEQVERVAIEVARALQRELPEADPDHEPFVRFFEFADSAISFNVILRARRFTDRWTIIHRFVKDLHERFQAEQIEIPFPQQVVHLRRPRSTASGELATTSDGPESPTEMRPR